MYWPSPSDYQDAIQNPNACFQSPELRAGQVALTPMGLPKVVSGNFASVYEITSNGQRWAVRCFLRQVSDQQRRYNLLSQHLAGFRIPSLVDFQYLPQGILVRGQWYPVVKMAWADGKTLNNFITESLSNPQVLLELAAKWRGLINSLRGNRLAHGDLQHGNIIVSPQGNLSLVDYDGMFTPSLRGERSPELGHENFQHPERNVNDYEENLDSFSALVIYLSLRALAYQPALWQQFHNGENLIFTRKDFQNPQQSPLFQQLKTSSDESVRRLANSLESCCFTNVAVLPEFETLIASLPLTNTVPAMGAASSSNSAFPQAPSSNLGQFGSPLPSWTTPSGHSGQVPATNQQFNNVANGQMAAIASAMPPIAPAPPIVKTKAPVWLILVAIFAGFIAFSTTAFSLYLSYQHNQEMSYMETDLSSLRQQLTEEKEKNTKLVEEMAVMEKALQSKKPYVDTKSTLGDIFDKALTLNRIDKLDAKVDSLKFYEGGYNGTARTDRVYLTSFSRNSRFVFWELNLTHPTRAAREDFTIDVTWYKDGVFWADGPSKTYVEPNWATSFHNNGKGWSEPGKWETGDYRVDLFVDGKKIATGNFSIVD